MASETFRWTKPKRRIAALLALDDLKDEEIAEKFDVTDRTLRNWKQHPEFRAEINRLTAEAAERTLARGIALREKRVEYANERHRRMRQVIAERATDPEMRGVPGGSTGLVVRQVKQVGSGRNAQIIEEYAVDTPLLREMREHEKHVAQDVGQWTEKQELTGKGGRPIQVQQVPPDLSDLTDEELVTLERIAARRTAGALPSGAGAAPAG